MAVSIGAASGTATGQQAPKVPIPEPGVPQITTLEGNFVRVGYNNEAYVILGYQMAQRSLKENWLMLEVGMTLMEKAKDQTLKRDAISLDIPNGTKVPLPNVEQYRKGEGDVQALQNRAKVQRDSINYFPPSASRACRLGFFADMDQRAVSWDQVELSSDRACLGRLYFEIPGGITTGQYWLNVKFAQTLVRVPFRIFTPEEEKLVSKNYKSIKKQVEDSFRKKS
ncbi:MAG TPA: hypothetical protein VH417_03900 [Vicinamibacterales bacterium]|jgi:hypothetical protein